MKLAVVALAVLVLSFAASARAQDEPPRLPVVVVDVQGNVPRFPRNQLLADSRGLTLTELPGMGLGAQLGVHLYPVRLKAITVGIGGSGVVTRAKQTPAKDVQAQVRAVTEEFRSLAGQVSLNFGSGNGWSYVSGGIGKSIWSIVPEGREPLEGDEEVLETINYGGGARWFAKSHLAFCFDVRFYAINPGSPSLPGKAGSPRTRFMVIGAGISVK